MRRPEDVPTDASHNVLRFPTTPELVGAGHPRAEARNVDLIHYPAELSRHVDDEEVLLTTN